MRLVVIHLDVLKVKVDGLPFYFSNTGKENIGENLI